MTPDAASAPVFVDESGRRHRTVRVIGWVLGAVVTGYLALLGISLVGSPGLVPLSLPALGQLLPGPAAAELEGAAGGHDPGSLVSRATTRPAMTPTPATAAGAVAVTHRTTTTRRSAAPTPHPTQSPSATSTPTHTPQANPSPAGSARPTHGPSSHPSPKNTKRSVSRPSPTATAT